MAIGCINNDNFAWNEVSPDYTECANWICNYIGTYLYIIMFMKGINVINGINDD